MKESKFVKTKIVAGYVILIAVCVLSVGYVYRAVVRFSTSDGSYSLLHTKRNVVGQTLYHLYQAESYGQLMIAGYKSYEARYKRELRTVRGYIDSLRNLAGEQDSLQTMRLDSIVRLLGDKERRTMNLRRTIRSAATASLLDKNIRELIGRRTVWTAWGFCATACRCVRWCRIRCPWRCRGASAISSAVSPTCSVLPKRIRAS